jgi:hypothetical protein
MAKDMEETVQEGLCSLWDSRPRLSSGLVRSRGRLCHKLFLGASFGLRGQHFYDNGLRATGNEPHVDVLPDLQIAERRFLVVSDYPSLRA